MQQMVSRLFLAPMTEAQRSYLHTLATEAALRIEELQKRTGRGGQSK